MKAKTVTLLVATGSAMALVASGIARFLFGTPYIPHLYCYLAQPWLIWSNVATDSLIAASYIAIFIALFWLARKLRSLPEMRSYIWICASFGLFILACGATHVMESVTIWIPVYRISVAFKAACALTSVGTAALFVKDVPQIAHRIRRFLEATEIEQRHIEALRKSEAMLDRTNRAAKVGGWELDLRTNQITWSANAARMHGRPPGYAPTLEEGIHYFAPEFRTAIREALHTAISDGVGWDLEVDLLRFDGGRLTVRLCGEAELRDGRPVRLFGYLRDKTEEIEQREALRKSEEFLDRTNRIAQVGGWEVDIPTQTVAWSDETYRMHGLPKSYKPSLDTALNFFTKDSREMISAALERAMTTGEPWDLEVELVRADKRQIWVRTVGNVEMKDGKPHRLAGAIQDKTLYVEARAALQNAHELLRVSLLSIGDAVVTKDLYGNITLMNSAAEAMTGWPASKAIGLPVREVFHTVHGATRKPFDIHIDIDTGAARRTEMSENVRLVATDGSERNIESCATPIYNSQGALVGSVLVFRDVTEQIRLISETAQVNKLQLDLKLKDQFLSHVSHELRSPLTSVYSFTSIIADNLAGETTAEQQQYLSIVLKNVLQLQAMIEDLLTVTQSKEGKLPIEPMSFAVEMAVRDAADMARPAAGAKRIALSVEDLTGLPDIWADPMRLRQIMIILLDNAIKFTPHEGKICVRATQDESMLRVEVEDTGCGIPLEQRARVFEKLYQIVGSDHADTSQAGRIGLGLGLHIARDLVRRQGGNIWITGDPARGSIFNFTLPLAAGNAQADSTGQGVPRRRKTDLPESLAVQMNPAA